MVSWGAGSGSSPTRASASSPPTSQPSRSTPRPPRARASGPQRHETQRLPVSCDLSLSLLTRARRAFTSRSLLSSLSTRRPISSGADDIHLGSRGSLETAGLLSGTFRFFKVENDRGKRPQAPLDAGGAGAGDGLSESSESALAVRWGDLEAARKATTASCLRGYEIEVPRTTWDDARRLA